MCVQLSYPQTLVPLLLPLFCLPQVRPGSAAAKAGILPTRRGFGGNIVPGDIILAIDTYKVSCHRTGFRRRFVLHTKTRIG